MLILRYLSKWSILLAVILLTPSIGVAGTLPVNIPSLDATVDKLLFYESDLGIPPQMEREYATEFPRSQARFINWELRLLHPKPGKKISFRLDAAYYKPKESILVEHHLDTFSEADWTYSQHSHGYGNDKPGTWPLGTYRVDVLFDGKTIVSDTFSVIPDTTISTTPDNPPSGEIDIPDDLGEL